MNNEDYFDVVNNLNIREKIAWKLKRFFSKSDRKLPVLQIGVGGFSTSGKTVLIDAMFMLFDHTLKAGYMPKKVSGLFKVDKKFQQSYDSHSTLRRIVAGKFHEGKGTQDAGKWNENTYAAKLRFCGKDIILLIRNLPGEIFNNYFTTPSDGGASVMSRLESFLQVNDKYSKIYRDIFRFDIPGKKNNTMESIEKLLNEIRDKFIAKHLDFMVPTDRDTFRDKHFYALMFYISSDYHIYCIKSGDTDDFDNNGIFPENDDNSLRTYLFCYTQFDTLMKVDTLPEPSAAATDLDSGFWASIRSIFSKKKVTIPESRRKKDKMLDYWLRMNQLYEDLENPDSNNINFDEWLTLRANTMGESEFRWFIATVAYNYSRQAFYQFEGQVAPHPTRKVWRKGINNERTPLGVLELMLYILFSWGKASNIKKLKMRNSLLSLPEIKQTEKVLEKISIK